MKRLACLLAAATLFCACGGQAQISELSFARVIGFDCAQGAWTVSAALVLPEREEKSKVLSASCASPAEGLTLLDAHSPETLFLGHVTAVLLGEELAKNGIFEVLDTLVRSPYFRFDLPVIVVHDNTAQATLERICDQNPMPGEAIERLFKGGEQTSVAGAVRLSEAVEMLEDPLRSLFLPYMTFPDGEMRMAGLALMQEDKLLTFLDEKQSLGLNFLTDRVEKCLLEKEDGTLARVNESRTRMKFSDGVFLIDVRMKTEILESGKRVASDPAIRVAIEQKQGEAVEKLIGEAIAVLKEYRCDAAGFARCFERAGGRVTKDEWEELFPRISVRVQVKAAFDADKPASDPIREEEKT